MRDAKKVKEKRSGEETAIRAVEIVGKALSGWRIH